MSAALRVLSIAPSIRKPRTHRNPKTPRSLLHDLIARQDVKDSQFLKLNPDDLCILQIPTLYFDVHSLIRLCELRFLTERDLIENNWIEAFNISEKRITDIDLLYLTINKMSESKEILKSIQSKITTLFTRISKIEISDTCQNELNKKLEAIQKYFEDYLKENRSNSN